MDFIRFINFSRGFNGLPLGLSPSNALASIYLEDFENNIRLCLQPNLYNRFVDDIIVIKYINKEDNEDPYNIETLFRNELKKLNLNINSAKTETITLNFKNKRNFNKSFSYLGYKFIFEENLKITIDSDKYKKIENNIKNLFYKYRLSCKGNKNFWVLYYNLKNILYGVTFLNKDGKKHKFGLAYSYKYINDKSCIYSLLKLCEDEIRKSPLTSKEKYKLFPILNVTSSEYKSRVKFNKDNSLLFLNNRLDYTNLSKTQKNVISKRLSIPESQTINSSKIFYYLKFDK